MAHCIERVFAILPPEREDQPSMDELVDAVTYIQAFIFNCFACLDNLAWIWVCEQQLTTDRGETIPAAFIGLGKKCRVVRQSLPPDFRKHLKSLDKWLAHLEMLSARACAPDSALHPTGGGSRARRGAIPVARIANRESAAEAKSKSA